MSYSSLGTPPPTVEIYPEWPNCLIVAIENAIATAWSLILSTKPLIIQTQDEDEITNELKTILVSLWKNNRVNGFSHQVFSQPTRDSKLPDFQGNSIDQMPDLTFYLVNPRSLISDAQFDAIFYECKVLNASKTMNMYANQGISRFIEGKYAWRMKHAGMIAYDFSIQKKSPVAMLTNYFDRKSKGNQTHKQQFYCLNNPYEPLSNLPEPKKNKMAVTLHQRPKMSGVQNTDITLRHIWLQE